MNSSAYLSKILDLINCAYNASDGKSHLKEYKLQRSRTKFRPTFLSPLGHKVCNNNNNNNNKATCFRDFQWLYSGSTLCVSDTFVRETEDYCRPICDMCLHQLLHMK
jgi:hypothetical protein